MIGQSFPATLDLPLIVFSYESYNQFIKSFTHQSFVLQSFVISYPCQSSALYDIATYNVHINITIDI